MTDNQTQPTAVSVEAHLAKVASTEQRADCAALIRLLGQVTKAEPAMWGPSIVGFGTYHYQYASGREGDSCLTGFAVRGKDLVVYLVTDGPEQQALLARLGKHKMGKACLYFRRLDDLDLKVLERLVADSIKATRTLYGKKPGS